MAAVQLRANEVRFVREGRDGKETAAGAGKNVVATALRRAFAGSWYADFVGTRTIRWEMIAKIAGASPG